MDSRSQSPPASPDTSYPPQRAEGSQHGKRGGPRTAAGKQITRRNALRHGLTATKLLPQIIPAGRVDDLRAKLTSELAPKSMLEELMVSELARHGAMLELAERAEVAVLRQAAANYAEFQPQVLAAGADAAETLLAAAVGGDALERFWRYRRGHERSLHASLKALRELVAARRPQTQLGSAPAERPIKERKTWHENQCLDWLRDRVANGAWSCPKCRHTAANWIASRNVVQCQGCRTQFGLRTGTVMAGSPLPLATWFSAIEVVHGEPKIVAAELARRIGMNRPTTAQNLLRKIRAAAESDHAERLLMGLTSAEPSV